MVKAPGQEVGPAERAAVAAWTSAEESLYGPLLADPPAYERVVGLVGTLVDHLRANIDDVPGLVAASERGAALVAEVAPEQALPWVPLDTALRAACALRYRELQVTRQQAERRRRLAEAAGAGETWVRLVDPGSIALPAVAPALVVHVASGMAIRCTIEMDPETGGARFVSLPVRVRLPDGDVIGPIDEAGAEQVAGSVAERDAQVARLQERIERLDSQGRVV